MEIYESSSCYDVRYPAIHRHCDKTETNGSTYDYCQQLNLIDIFMKADCYIEKVFLQVAGSLVIIGTILNLFSLYCLYKMKKRNSQNVYLSVLSLADTMNLQINFTLPILRQSSKFDEIFRSTSFICRLSGVLTEFFLIFPTWVIVLLTFECLIFITWPLKRRSSYSQTHAKIAVAFLAFIVLGLSLYRLKDLKGIDQVSVFSVVACNETHQPIDFMTNLNLMVWTLVPECLTLIMSLIIIYQIKLATRQFQRTHSKARQLKYSQATKTVLLISILFLIFHTPTGILIALNLIHKDKKKNETLGIIIMLVSRKVTIVLYEIGLGCKFFIYQRTLQNFRSILDRSLSHFFRRKNSAKLGQQVSVNPFNNTQRHIIHFRPCKPVIASTGSQSDSLTRQIGECHGNFPKRQPRTSSTTLSRTNREYQPLTVLMTKNNDAAHVVLPTTPDFIRANKEKKRSLWSNKSQMSF